MKIVKNYNTVRLILGDQLNAGHSWFSSKQDDVLYIVAELPQEATYVVHHKQKVLAFFAAMKGFAEALQQAGHEVLYLTLDDTADFKQLDDLLLCVFEQTDAGCFEYQLPDEFRLREQLSQFCNELSINSRVFSTEHFYVDDEELDNYFKPNKSHRMETFYRKMRAKHNVMMEGNEPLGGQWNFDKDNRNKFKAKDLKDIPKPLMFENDVKDVIERLARHEVKTIGEAESRLLWPINRKQALALLSHFLTYCLPRFGYFQDAMTGKLQSFDSDDGWSLYHSRISFALNTKMISPKQVVDSAVIQYQNRPDEIDLAQVEGFVRQILGWREFVRGMYWANMPEYRERNFLGAQRQLPSWFWDAKTEMACQRHAIKQSLQFAYAHHIQRLMVTGNFCLIAGIDPDEVDSWYLGVYIDAIEWVEMPNTRGMSQFADGGLVGSKPYAASGNYTNKMSDYCSDCYYDVKSVTEARSCPLNALYWNFVNDNLEVMKRNPRLNMVVANWQKKTVDQQEAITEKAKNLLSTINDL